MPRNLPLFASADIKLPSEKAAVCGRGDAVKSSAVRVKSQQVKRRLAQRSARCAEVVGELEKGDTIHLVSAAEWSAHNLIEHLAATTGPVDLYFATWSISEDGLRAMMRDNGQLESINAILDWRIHIRNREVTQLARANVDQIKVYSCHAKVYILRNAKWGVSIVSSANLTNNPRIEASVITEDLGLADWHIGWMTEVLAGAAPFGDL